MSKAVRIPPSSAVALYLTYKEAEGLAPKTLAKYRATLADFLATPGLPAHVGDLEPGHAVAYLARLRTRGLVPGSIATYQRAVWTWFTWLYMGDYCPVDISRRVKRVRVTNPKRRTATADTHDKFVALAADSREHPRRAVALVELLWGTGLRRAEVAALDLGDIDFEAGTVLVRSGKGDKKRVSGIEGMARIRLREYIILERGEEPGPLFISRRGGRLSNGGLKMALRRLAERAGIEASSHDFRRAHAARLLAADVPADAVARQLGHSKVDLTLVYGEEGRTESALRAFHAADRARRAK